MSTVTVTMEKNTQTNHVCPLCGCHSLSAAKLQPSTEEITSSQLPPPILETILEENTTTTTSEVNTETDVNTTTNEIKNELKKMTISEEEKNPVKKDKKYKLDVTKDLFSTLEEEKKEEEKYKEEKYKEEKKNIIGRKRVFIIFDRQPNRPKRHPYYLGECEIDEKEDIDVVKEIYANFACKNYWKIGNLGENVHVVFEYFNDLKGYVPYAQNFFASVYIKAYVCYCEQDNHYVYFERKDHTNNILREL